jgi:multiple antibiotic resistance protein
MDFFSSTLLLLFIMDPFGNIPLFHSLLLQVDPQRRSRVVVRELLIAYGVLLLFLFGGDSITRHLGLKEPTLSIAGGLILLLIAIGMVFPRHGLDPDERPADEEPFVVPLAVPMIAGPSAVAAVLLLISRAPERLLTWLAALSCAWLLTALVLIASGRLYERIGDRGARAIERLIGMVLIMMAVQMFLDGVGEYLGLD